jgi:hypothetical protein
MEALGQIEAMLSELKQHKQDFTAGAKMHPVFANKAQNRKYFGRFTTEINLSIGMTIQVFSFLQKHETLLTDLGFQISLRDTPFDYRARFRGRATGGALMGHFPGGVDIDCGSVNIDIDGPPLAESEMKSSIDMCGACFRSLFPAPIYMRDEATDFMSDVLLEMKRTETRGLPPHRIIRRLHYER